MAISLLALLDDISALMDDVAVLTKITTKKTIGVVGDDLALNANQFSGVSPERELPIVFKVAVGSLINKAILVPAAMVISFFIPSLIFPLLFLGGLYLCFEGVEKILSFFYKNHQEEKQFVSESDKIKGAIRTDFILSAEIIVISLGMVANSSLINQLITLIVVSILVTVGVYGIVALIIKFDDLGLFLLKKEKNFLKKIGMIILKSAPIMLKTISVVGTVAMFLVGGSIFCHVSSIHFESFSSFFEILIGIALGLFSLVSVLFFKEVLFLLRK